MTEPRTTRQLSTPRFALLVLAGAYPGITAILYLLLPLTGGWAIWQKTLLVAPMMVAAMVWGVIPVVHRRFAWFISRPAALAILAGACAVGTPFAAEGQDTTQRASRWEFNIPSGMLIPAGRRGGVLKRGDHSAAQLAWLVRPSLAVTTTLGWTRTRDLATADERRLDVFMYDVGAEWRGASHAAQHFAANSFVGVGAGGRTYDYRGVRADATHNPAAYASVGGDIGGARVRLRLEARDYLTGFKALAVGQSRRGTRHDVLLMASLRLVRR